MKRRGELPIVGILACQKQRRNGTSYSRVNDHVTERLARYSEVLPVILPAARADLVVGCLDELDGLVLPGSGSFVHPTRYTDAPVPVLGREYDPGRDEVALALLRRAAEIPELAILGSCRGMQEIAVAQGAQLRDLTAGADTHRFVPPAPGGDRWAPAHPILLAHGGLLSEITSVDRRSEIAANSQHTQVVTAPAGQMKVEAQAPDGVIEAISVGWPHRYVLGVQWHFEHNIEPGSLNQRILQAFGQQCRVRHSRRGNR